MENIPGRLKATTRKQLNIKGFFIQFGNDRLIKAGSMSGIKIPVKSHGIWQPGVSGLKFKGLKEPGFRSQNQ
jgi:hypothetical protein